MTTHPPTTAERILDTAQGLIIASGYNGFSYADIAGAVGIRKASIHHHFPAKADLVEALLIRYRHEAETAARRMLEEVADPRDRLRFFAGYWQGCIADGSRPFCICALLASEIDILPDQVALQVRGYFQHLTATFARTMAAGAGAGVLSLSDTPEAEAEVYVATIHGAMMSARATGDPSVFARIARLLLARLIPAI